MVRARRLRDEADWSSNPKPIWDAASISEIAEVLGVSDDAYQKRLAHRIQRYSDRYIFARKRERFKVKPGDTTELAKKSRRQIANLLRTIAELEFCDEFLDLNAKAKRDHGSRESVSLPRMKGELQKLESLVLALANAPKRKAGHKGLPILDHWVGAFMALFDTTPGRRPKHRSSREGIKGDYVDGPGGQALRFVFNGIDPDLTESQLARAVKRMTMRSNGQAMRERDFDLISKLEDVGSFDITQNQ